jgi:predicted transcriptional regulator of viral defense system
VTTRAQTLVEGLPNPGRAGGVEETVRSCSAFPYLDVDALLEILNSAPVAVVARAGWLLEAKQGDWGVASETLLSLKERLGRGPSKLDPKSQENRGWNRRWKLYLPESEEEVLSWTS